MIELEDELEHARRARTIAIAGQWVVAVGGVLLAAACLLVGAAEAASAARAAGLDPDIPPAARRQAGVGGGIGYAVICLGATVITWSIISIMRLLAAQTIATLSQTQRQMLESMRAAAAKQAPDSYGPRALPPAPR